MESRNGGIFVMKMRKIVCKVLSALLCIFSFVGCNQKESTMKNTYEQITPAEAKGIMDNEHNYIILDVRTEEEFAEGHVKDAILIPDTEITEKAEGILTDKEQQILVYCRSGRRSKNAANQLVELGYSNVKEFGGIIDWPYGTTKE
jgi:rhodanese-related sulfurtransferase